MIRFLSAFGALAATSFLAAGVSTALPLQQRAAPIVIGVDDPVFLGRLVVSATPLPGPSARP